MRVDRNETDGAFALERAETFLDAALRQPEALRTRHLDRDKIWRFSGYLLR